MTSDGQERVAASTDQFRHVADGSQVGVIERDPWTLVERWCDRYPHDWRLLFKRGDEVLEVSVPEEVWRAFDT